MENISPVYQSVTKTNATENRRITQH